MSRHERMHVGVLQPMAHDFPTIRSSYDLVIRAITLIDPGSKFSISRTLSTLSVILQTHQSLNTPYPTLGHVGSVSSIPFRVMLAESRMLQL